MTFIAASFGETLTLVHSSRVPAETLSLSQLDRCRVGESFPSDLGPWRPHDPDPGQRWPRRLRRSFPVRFAMWPAGLPTLCVFARDRAGAGRYQSSALAVPLPRAL